MDKHDRALLIHLAKDSSTSNALIGEEIGLSTSQVSRRRLRLEAEGVITGYRADISYEALGLQLNAFIKVRLKTHNKASSANFKDLVQTTPSIILACTLTGDADYLLHVRVRDLKDLSNLINGKLLTHPDIGEVRSDVVLDMLKDDRSIEMGVL